MRISDLGLLFTTFDLGYINIFYKIWKYFDLHTFSLKIKLLNINLQEFCSEEMITNISSTVLQSTI